MSIEIEDLKRVNLKPGDRLALKFKKPVSREMHAAISEDLARWIGPDVKVLVLPPDAELTVVGKEEAPAEADAEN